ncbi:SirB2 family protein [Paraburkholderia phymatum]|uniref:SirB2 family protein n=1 Tax=Paraburkholderia phymatum TaxID=148447 RepID=A0ACC6U377_9BURK
MPLIELYPYVKLAHVSFVTGSGLLFATRGAAVLTGRAWPTRPGWRRLSYVIDTSLLAAGGALWLMLHLNPVRDAWLGAKLLMLVAYIVAGSFALKHGRTRFVRCVSLGCAIALYLLIVSVAVTHRPLGLFAQA